MPLPISTLYDGSLTAFTIGLATTPLASSSTFLTGRSSAEVTNSSNWLDVSVEGHITVGTTPTSGTSILVYAYGAGVSSTSVALDTIVGTDADKTLSSAGVRDSMLIQIANINVDSATSNRAYYFYAQSLARLFGLMPQFFGLFVTHNTGVALNSTAGNHVISYQGFKFQY